MTLDSELPPANATDDELPDAVAASLPLRLRRAIESAGWPELMPVQAKTIPYVLAGHDVMVQSKTGSGKTGAFLLPLLERIDPELAACQVLVLVPTRELAVQVGKEAEILGGACGIASIAVYGGVSYVPQNEAFKRGTQIVVGTPGRILDHLIRGTLVLDDLAALVFDEADRLLSMGFYPDMKRIHDFLPERTDDLNVLMFSATFPPHVLRLANEFLDQPEIISLSRDQVHVAHVQHIRYAVPAMLRDRALVRILEQENPASAIIFCNTKEQVHYVAVVLRRFGYDADELISDLSQSAREHVLARVRRGALRFLVATDVAARGIDIPELSHVIQYEPPEDAESYIHRAGRTGRAGAAGSAIILASDERNERFRMSVIIDRYSIEFQDRELPNEQDLAKTVSERATALLEARLRTRDRLKVERMQRFARLARELMQTVEGLSLVTMLLDDYYHAAFHGGPSEFGDAANPSGIRPAYDAEAEARTDGASKETGAKSPRRRRRRRPPA